MVKVLHVNSNYLTSKLHENLMDFLENENRKNTVFMPIKPGKQKEFLYESKYDVYFPESFNDKDKYVFTWKQSKIMKSLMKTLNPDKFDLIHAHTLFTDGNVAYELNKKFGLPYVVTVRGYTDINQFFKIRMNLRHRGRKILRAASFIVFLSETNRNELLEDYIKDESLKQRLKEKSIVLPNGIDPFWFENEGAPKTLSGPNEVNVISVGKIMKLKNQLTTVKALKILKEEYDLNVSLTLAGKIFEKGYAEKVNNQNDIPVNMVGTLPKEKLIDLYREHDVYVMPSFYETFGLVYPEAMSQGLPVIYTKGQGFYMQFEEGKVGYGVDADDPYDIAEKILKTFTNYNSISKNSLQGYKKFNWSKLSNVYIKMYETLERIGRE